MLQIYIVLIFVLVINCGCESVNKRYEYVAKNNPVLHTPSQLLRFPLKAMDLQDIKALQDKFDAEENCAGLAAPQLGISKAAIIFALPDDPEIKKFRKDMTQTMGKILWINPQYTPVGDDMTDDWEVCFSLPGEVCLVPRYKTIIYEAYDINGVRQKGLAVGFLARIIQHETDHTLGIVCSKKAREVMKIEEYREMRRRALGN